MAARDEPVAAVGTKGFLRERLQLRRVGAHPHREGVGIDIDFDLPKFLGALCERGRNEKGEGNEEERNFLHELQLTGESPARWHFYLRHVAA